MRDFGAVIDLVPAQGAGEQKEQKKLPQEGGLPPEGQPDQPCGGETRCQMKEQVLPDRQCGTSVQ